MQYLFQEYDLFTNGVVLYSKIIDKLLNIYWDEKRNNLSKDFYNHLTERGNKNISLNDIRNIYINTPNDSYKKDIFSRFLDDYKFITSAYTDKPLSLNEIIKFVKFFGYGIQSDYELREMLFELDEQKILNPKIEEQQYQYNDNNGNNNYYYNNKNNKRVQFQNYKPSNKEFENNFKANENNIKNKIDQPLITLRKYLIKYGRKSFFNFIKHFKYYDNNTKTINKYDFVKVLKDFNINIPLLDIENIFFNYGINNKKDKINYIDFLNKITESSINQLRDNSINDSLNKLLNLSNENNCPITVNLLKNYYNPRNNYFIGDQTENRNDFENCLELYHYFFKGFRNDIFSEDEFFEFYHFISYLIENDNDFISLLNNEWNFRPNYRQIEDKKEPIFLNKNDFDNNKTFEREDNREIIRKFNKDYNENVNEEENLDNLSTKNNPRTPYQRSEKNYFINENNNNTLEKLKQKLRIRGIRGLLYLHRQFLMTCPNLMKITFNDFKNVLQGQHILFNESEYENLFEQFSKDDYLQFTLFIREFKKQLNETKLNYVENAFSILDSLNNGNVTVNLIKMNYDVKNHPDVISGRKNEEEKLLEFIDCFEINNEILNNNNNNYIDFEIFANFYEYVAFVYENDNEFGNIINATFHE